MGRSGRHKMGRWRGVTGGQAEAGVGRWIAEREAGVVGRHGHLRLHGAHGEGRAAWVPAKWVGTWATAAAGVRHGRERWVAKAAEAREAGHVTGAVEAEERMWG